jgi:hypothetical protein
MSPLPKPPVPNASCGQLHTLATTTNEIKLMSTTEQLLAVSQLKKRGWTDSLISRFLGDPDELRRNPHYRSGPPMKLYNVERIEQAEASTEFCDAQDARKNRRDAAQKALATKKQKIADYVENVKIEVPRLAKGELIRRACDNYNANVPGWKYDAPLANEHSAPTFLERICVNYLRHCLTKYETHLGEIAGKVGVRDAYFGIKTRVLEAIAEEYDWLSDECRRQEQRMRVHEVCG